MLGSYCHRHGAPRCTACNVVATGVQRRSVSQWRYGEETPCGPDIRIPRASSNGTVSRSATRCSARASRPGLRSHRRDRALPGLEGPGTVLGADPLVVTIDPRGNGRSDRPQSAAAYADAEFVADTIAVMDAVGIEGRCWSGCAERWHALLTSVLHPDRVLGVVASPPGCRSSLRRCPPVSPVASTRCSIRQKLGQQNRHYWQRDWRGYAEFFFSELLSEPHSTKQHEDCVGWAMEIGPETMLVHDDGPISPPAREDTEALLVGSAARCWSSTDGMTAAALRPR